MYIIIVTTFQTTGPEQNFYDGLPLLLSFGPSFKNFPEDQLHSSRFPVFPGGIKNSRRFPGFPEVIDTLLAHHSCKEGRLNKHYCTTLNDRSGATWRTTNSSSSLKG